MSATDLPQPDHARNMRVIAYCDQGGRPDGVQIMVHRGHAYIGHMSSKGFSVLDVRDPKRPRAVNYLAAPSGTWNIHLQTMTICCSSSTPKTCSRPPSSRTRSRITR